MLPKNTFTEKIEHFEKTLKIYIYFSIFELKYKIVFSFKCFVCAGYV